MTSESKIAEQNKMIADMWLGDCLELMNNIQDGSIDMICADLPQGITRNPWDIIIPFVPLWGQYNRVIKPNGAIVLFANQPFTSELILSNKKMFKYSMVWQKTSASGFLNAKRMPLRAHEDICVFYKKPPVFNPQKTTGHPRKVSTASHKRNCKETENYGKHSLTNYDSTERYPTSVLKFKHDKQRSSLHATQKPVSLLENLVKSYTNEGDTVLDNCAGSFSIAEACLNINRGFIVIEKDSVEFDKGRNRILTLTAQPKEAKYE